MNRNLAFAVSIALLFGVSAAGTVTLTGSCAVKNLTGGAIFFNLSNSGNDTAYNLVITPFLQNVKTSRSFYGVNSLGPGAGSSTEVGINSISDYGVSTGYFLTSYQQGTDVFSAVFPCLYTLGTQTSSQVLITEKTAVSSDGNATVTVSAFNKGSGQEKVNVSLMLPPAFVYTGASQYLLTLGPVSTPSSTQNATFDLYISPSTQGSYSVAASASYKEGNLSHATLTTFVISGPAAATGSTSSLLVYGAALVVAILLALILMSLMRRRQRASPASVAAAPIKSPL